MKGAAAKPMSAQKKAYLKYLESETWIKLRCDIITIRGDKCERCGKGGVHVHHRSYKNLGHEEPEDLVLLCGSCHMETHNIKKPCAAKQKRLSTGKKNKQLVNMYRTALAMAVRSDKGALPKIEGVFEVVIDNGQVNLIPVKQQLANKLSHSDKMFSRPKET